MRRPGAVKGPLGGLLGVAAVVAVLQAQIGASSPAAAPVTTTVAVTTSTSTTSTSTSTTSTASTSTTSTSTSTSTTASTTTTTLAPGPAGFADAVRAGLGDPRFEGATVGLAVWVEGAGMVVNHNADLPLRPGSNEKLLVAWAAYGAIGADATLTTEVRADGDHLILVGGGDPSLRSTGPHSLDRLAAMVRAQGVTEVAGDLVADESRFDTARRAAGWTERHAPLFVGPVSALAVDGNVLRGDPEYLADPAAGNLAEFRAALGRHGVTVAGGERAGAVPETATVVASLESAPVSQLVRHMLTNSDNFSAEMLLKEAGRRALGLGSWENGVAAVRELAAGAGVVLTGRAADGSGLSRENSRPAREWAELLVAARDQPWFDHLLGGLPVAGRTGTLANRFVGTAGEANVRAKTGSVRESRSLSGYVTTAGGRQVVFSLVVNANPLPPAVIGAIDGLVSSMAASPA